ncbi:protein FAR1-RELATED SEQUENCE 3 isoform X2 [Prunus yedoensis var. nudiflora]|uniref:Protein FAR1-RELATED SEQUENCE n=1 Tax=Prunus yedoensis var. nudiflora TaxID=2094558 RepID=A0A314ZXQ5_PRUYE|nr:protein FAR1-RELATED SEQUENCE 3 isoform X2 [Prunus yedoensis var. nudiflora]
MGTVYFRGTFFAAIFSNQGVGSFFHGYVNQQTSIPLFFKQYERALELSIEKEIEADYDTTSTTPVLKTRSPMEQQAANLYTKKVFAKFQEELVETFVYTANKIEGDGLVSKYRVAKYEHDDKAYIVTLNVSEMKASCSCQMFEYSDEQSSENQGIEKDAAISALREGGKKIAVVKKNVAKVTPPSSHASGNIQEDNMKKSPLPLGEMAPSLWPWQEALPHRFNLNDGGVPVADLNQPSMAPVSIHPDGAHPDNTVVLTCFKSMAWIIENKNSTSAGKVAVINLKAATI